MVGHFDAELRTTSLHKTSQFAVFESQDYGAVLPGEAITFLQLSSDAECCFRSVGAAGAAGSQLKARYRLSRTH